MTKRLMQSVTLLAIVLALNCSPAGAQTERTQSKDRQGIAASEFDLSRLFAQVRPMRRVGFSLMPANRAVSSSFAIPAPAGPSLTVLGSGTVGRITKWAGFTSSNSFIAETTIFEDKFGKVGIGTDSPTSKLTVAGMIEITLGGLKFPDGTVQTTSAAGMLSTVAHDTTLTGNGTAGSPLGVAIPLVLSGAVVQNFSGGVIEVTNTATSGRGIKATGGPSGIGVVATGGNSSSPSGFGAVGVFASGGLSESGTGGTGVFASGGLSESGTGGVGLVASGGGASGAGTTGGIGIDATGGSGELGATPGLAGRFNGNVQVLGTLSKGGGSFRIDHPLDPENRYLYHSFVESPDMKNIYDGNVFTDENGAAVVMLPDYFDALNRDFRYQLTVIGTFAHAIVADEIKDNSFTIRTSAPNVKVSWQVTGIRRDAFANKNRIPVEEDKTELERGYYLHPEAFDLPEEKSIQWARDPKRMKQLKQRRLEAEQAGKQNQLDR